VESHTATDRKLPAAISLFSVPTCSELSYGTALRIENDEFVEEQLG
jgi:hypothetical protein